MATNSIKHFRATLEPLSVSLVWVVARVPFEVKAVWPKLIRLRVEIELAGEVYRTALFSHPAVGHCVVINKRCSRLQELKPGT